MIEGRTGRCLDCGQEVLLERSYLHRAAECPVKRELFPLCALEYLPLEFGGVGPAGPDYDERQQLEALQDLRDLATLPPPWWNWQSETPLEETVSWTWPCCKNHGYPMQRSFNGGPTFCDHSESLMRSCLECLAHSNGLQRWHCPQDGETHEEHLPL